MTANTDWLDDPEVQEAAGQLVEALQAAAAKDGGAEIVAFGIVAHRSDNKSGVLTSGDDQAETVTNMLQALAESYGAETELTIIQEEQVH